MNCEASVQLLQLALLRECLLLNLHPAHALFATTKHPPLHQNYHIHALVLLEHGSETGLEEAFNLRGETGRNWTVTMMNIFRANSKIDVHHSAAEILDSDGVKVLINFLQ